MAESIPRDPTPRQPLGIGRVFVILSVQEVGNLSANLCPGYVGHMSILLKAVNIVPFSIFQITIGVFGETKICLASGRWITSSKSHRAVPDPNFEIRGGQSSRPLGSKGGVVVRALASLQCGSTPGVHAICGLSLLLVLSLAPRGFSPGTQVFPHP